MAQNMVLLGCGLEWPRLSVNGNNTIHCNLHLTYEYICEVSLRYNYHFFFWKIEKKTDQKVIIGETLWRTCMLTLCDTNYAMRE